MIKNKWGSAVLIAFICLFFCSCATPPPLSVPLPSEISFNKDAGRGGCLLIKLHLDDGPELLFAVDTGSPCTILDKSLEPKLGKCLGTKKFRYDWYGRTRMNLYQTPKFYSGNTQLLIDNTTVRTDDLKQLDPGIMGILGMDCLRHYCIQLDFSARKMRFLDPDQNAENFGKAFPLTTSFGNVFIHADFYGLKNVRFCPDTGGLGGDDATVNSSLFQRVLKVQKPLLEGHPTKSVWKAKSMALLSKGVIGGIAYTNITLFEWDGISWLSDNLLGLQFLARNLVTFDFPKQVMFLKQENVGPLAPGYFITIEAEKFFESLREHGTLPGWPLDEKGGSFMANAIATEAYPITGMYKVSKKGDPCVYHYAIVKPSKEAVWKLQKAWRTDASGRTLEEYPVP
jgi:hypothetical protein